MVNEPWNCGPAKSEPLTFAKIQEAVRKAGVASVQADPVMLVHPLRWLLISRRCDPVYCRLMGVRLVANWRAWYDQTFADYYGWGINGHE